jgi:hypothetical protein
MKRLTQLLTALIVFGLLAACTGSKPQYKTTQGKKRLKYYNSIQYR